MDIQDTDAPDGGDASAAPQPSPASFWDRSTWDPNSLGAAAFGEPTPPYRSPGQITTDALDALLTGPSHPGWSEPVTRRAIDNFTAAMPMGAPRGLLDEGMQWLADQGHPDFQAWAANRAALNAGAHPLSGLWAMNQSVPPAVAPAEASGGTAATARDENTALATTQTSDTSEGGASDAANASETAAAPVNTLTTSPQAAATIRTFEAPGGRPLGRYGSIDGGTDTMGLGHKLLPGEAPGKFDPEAAYKADLRRAENLVKGAVTVPLQQHQFDALVSFAMNEPGAFRPSTSTKPNAFLDAVNGGDMSGAADHMLMNDTYFDKKKNRRIASGGLQRRRFHEADMFSNGIYRPF
jgi:GH24 family phage-related lysozyme (muramidase)